MIPMRGKVMIKVEEDSEVTPGGIYVGGTSAAKSNRGTVRYVGPGLWANGGVRPPIVQPGDVVLFSGTFPEVEHQGETLAAVPEDNIIAIV